MDRRIDLSSFIQHFDGARHYSGDNDVTVQNLFIDSRCVKPRDVFLACKGYRVDGRKYIKQAIERGVSLIICEAVELDETDLIVCNEQSISCVLVPELNGKLSEIADIVFAHPSENLFSIGITGTNGKSSCVQMLSQALHLIDGCCWTLGTLGCGPVGAQRPTENTTADAVTVQRELAKAVEFGCGNAALEVSSHGIVEGRISHVMFDVAIFTNLTRDHLDFHQTMEAYGDAKRQLFLSNSLKWAVINVDDKFGRKLKKDDEIKANKLFISLNEPLEGADLNQWIWADDIRLTNNGIQARIYTPWGTAELKVPLIGRFNLYNLLAVIAVLGCKLESAEQVMQIVNQLHSVIGRMQLIKQSNKPLVIVDYAHTPDALEQALKAAREHCGGKIIVVFGCGGDRDTGKRPLMAKIAEKLASRVIFTDDNPRFENAEKIIEDMQVGLKNVAKVPYISDRKNAIREAISIATKNDLVLIAGKGHEDYQIVGETREHMSDIETAQLLLAELEGAE